MVCYSEALSILALHFSVSLRNGNQNQLLTSERTESRIPKSEGTQGATICKIHIGEVRIFRNVKGHQCRAERLPAQLGSSTHTRTLPEKSLC